VLQLIAEHPQRRLELSAWDGQPAILNEIDLSLGAMQTLYPDSAIFLSWENAEFRGAQLRRANFQGAQLRRANLQGVQLEQANLQLADLAGADLQHAVLGEANLQGAMLEEANLQGAALRFANLQGAILEGANLQQADLWGANLHGAMLVGANLQGAVLAEANLQGVDLARANLQGSVLIATDLHGANLTGVNLQEAVLEGTNFQDAVLKDTRLQGLVLSNCNITHVYLSGARLDETRFTQEQLGGALGEELAEEYKEASHGYLALERTFRELGDPDAASWAYRKKRRMQKLATWQQARAARAQRHWRLAARLYAQYGSDQFVEWLCDYGESIGRVLASLVVVYGLFTLLYGLTGSVVRLEETPAGVVRVPTQSLADLAIFSLVAMASPDGAPVGLLQRNQLVHVLTGTQTLLGIALTGLLGFVIGNRIRRE
jgi:uncharacterized protein YjbI with pentapeptide repeats